MRFIEYDGDMMILAAAKINEEKNRKQHSDSDEDSKKAKLPKFMPSDVDRFIIPDLQIDGNYSHQNRANFSVFESESSSKTERFVLICTICQIFSVI